MIGSEDVEPVAPAIVGDAAHTLDGDRVATTCGHLGGDDALDKDIAAVTYLNTGATALGADDAATHDSHVAHLVADDGAYDPGTLLKDDGLTGTRVHHAIGEFMPSAGEYHNGGFEIEASLRCLWHLDIGPDGTGGEELQVVIDVVIDLYAQVMRLGERETECGVVDHSRQNAQ